MIVNWRHVVHLQHFKAVRCIASIQGRKIGPTSVSCRSSFTSTLRSQMP